MSKFYTGVGARKAPKNILKIMTSIATKLDKMDFILRSGGAIGSDKAFESGSLKKEIFRPRHANEKSDSIVKKFHPQWNELSEYVKMLHSRNAFQLLGLNLNSKSSFLLCWTPDGAISHEERSIKTGGTGTAISIADSFQIPVYNLKRDDHFEKILKWLNK